MGAELERWCPPSCLGLLEALLPLHMFRAGFLLTVRRPKRERSGGGGDEDENMKVSYYYSCVGRGVYKKEVACG